MGIALLLLGMATLYFIAIAMPNKKWLGALFILYSALIGGFYFLFSRSGDWMGLILLMGVCATAYSGIFTKALSLFLRRKGYSKRIYLFPLFLGLPIGAAIFVFPFKYHDWKERSVDKTCHSRLFPFKINDVTFSLPFSPIFSVYFENFNSLEAFKEGILFHEASGIRDACDMMNNSNAPIPGTKLGIIIQNVQYARRESVHASLCQSTQIAWEKELCPRDLKIEELGYPPAKIYIYSKAAFSAPWDQMQSQTTYERYNNLGTDSSPNVSDIKGYVLADHHYYWVADNPEWKTPDGNPFALSCDASIDKTTVSCLVVYGLTDQVNVQFMLWGPSQEVPEKAWKQNNKLLSLINDIRTKSN